MSKTRWLPGEHEALMCSSKIAYKSGAAAGKAKAGMKRRTHGDLNVYRCPYCDLWHLGRPKRERAPKKRKRPSRGPSREVR